MKCVGRDSKISGQTEHVYAECQYRTRKTWPWKRRVIYKAEVVPARGKKPKDNPRLVVTNMKQSPQSLHERSIVNEGSRKPDQGTALRDGNRTHQLHELLGQSVACLNDRGSLRVDAGTTLRPGWHRFCACTSLHVARAFSETRSSRDRVGTSHRTALAAVVSLST